MTDLVFKSNDGVAVTTSLMVSKIFGKDHDKVMRDIKNLSCSEEFRAANFGDSSYTSQQNKELPMSVMTKDGFSFLVMGYNGKKAASFKEAYIAAFNAMEKELKEQAKPKSQLEIIVESAQALLEQSRRMDKIESRLDAMEQEREENTRLLLSVSVSQNELPKQSIRNKIRELVNKYSSAMNIKQGDVWHSVYNQLYYLFNISVNSYKRKKKESNLDVAERIGFIDKIYDIISNMVREAKIA